MDMQSSVPAENDNRRYYIFGAIAFLIVVIAAGVLFHLRQVRVAHIAAAQAQVDRYQAALTSFQALGRQFIPKGTDYQSRYDDALAVSRKRHDDSLSSSPNDEAEYGWAKTEVNDVEAMQADATAEEDVLSRMADTLENLYGSEAVANMRNDILKYTTAQNQALSSWARASRDVKDGLQESVDSGDDSENSSDIEHFYNDADQQTDEANTLTTAITNDASILMKRLQSDLEKAQGTLRKAKAS